ncbi:flagellar assembly protein FliW [Spongisporangium articulatum]|uniref:Flagellar assembly factor FliW n=1 Tax=Spongisporangium articulatum TaxID=3362603 RepID=A0ABW8AHL3_9ACTN
MNSSVDVAERGANSSDDGVGEEFPSITFVHSVPGFPGLRKFALVGLDLDEDDTEGSEAPEAGDGVPAPRADGEPTGHPAVVDPVLHELRSLDQPDIRFMVATAYAFFPDYNIELDDQVCENLALTDAADALVLVILTLGQDIGSTTANLLAPVVVNGKNRSAAQVILSGSEWPVHAPLG